MWSQLANSFQQGDGYLYAILILSFIGIVIVFERIITLLFVYNLDFDKFLSNLKKMVRAEDNDRAMNLCKKVSKTSLPSISLRALEAAETDPTKIEGTIEEEAIGFLPKIEARISVIPAIATLILMVGVLGTIDSLWAAFSSLDVLDTSQKQASLAHGIAGSLNHVAAGILFSMLLLAGHYFIRGISLRLIDRLHHGVSVLHNLLVPKNTMHYAAAPMAGGSFATPHNSQPIGGDFIGDDDGGAGSSNETLTEHEATDESFDESAIDDIKDEEEII